MNLILGDGLALRMPAESDRERWLELLHDPEQLRFGMPSVIPVPETVEEIDERVAEARRKYAAREPTTFVIVVEHDPELFLGTVGYSFHVPAPLRVADVGYSVHPDARGRGVATGALRTLTRWLITESGRATGGTGPARPQRREPGVVPHGSRGRLRAGGHPPVVPAAPGPRGSAGARRHDVCLHGLVADEQRAW